MRNNFMLGVDKKKFASLYELNQKAAEWVEIIANTRKHGTTEERPVDRWNHEKQFLNFPNNVPDYPTSSFVERRVTIHGCVQYNKNFYDVPPGFASKKVRIYEINNNGIVSINIYYEDTIIATYLLSSGRGNWLTKPEYFLKVSSQTKKNPTKKYRKKRKPQWALYNIEERPNDYYDRLIQERNRGFVVQYGRGDI